ncbi:hypothetical protein T265_04908 [Opisthorchis viverrini]|uniref:Uncharacterized protein n=1 Tax=Opisthorchis viverrini TaxID=6198 RepID=A0A074ZME3_OPIVI|nr:hypothetical protein T265_04908 [Opisthorchis viverrini]KER28236.1 hypothetical protein T265_04908 [Opisthorchis viverrini]
MSEKTRLAGLDSNQRPRPTGRGLDQSSRRGWSLSIIIIYLNFAQLERHASGPVYIVAIANITDSVKQSQTDMSTEEVPARVAPEFVVGLLCGSSGSAPGATATMPPPPPGFTAHDTSSLASLNDHLSILNNDSTITTTTSAMNCEAISNTFPCRWSAAMTSKSSHLLALSHYYRYE